MSFQLLLIVLYVWTDSCTGRKRLLYWLHKNRQLGAGCSHGMVEMLDSDGPGWTFITRSQEWNRPAGPVAVGSQAQMLSFRPLECTSRLGISTRYMYSPATFNHHFKMPCVRSFSSIIVVALLGWASWFDALGGEERR